MEMPTPPELDAARRQVEAALEQVEKKKIDLFNAPWAEIEKSVIKLLGGPFKLEQPEHHLVALGLAAAFGGRLGAESGAFWFPSRESPEGAQLGFPEALLMLSPYGAVIDALMAAKLEMLDQLAKDVRNSLAQVKFSGGAQPQRLTPTDYMRLFDPGFVQLVALDQAKVNAAFDLTPDRLSIDLREALSRAGQKIPPDAKQQIEQQLVGALSRMEKGKPLKELVAKAPRVAELVAHLWGSTAASGSAPEEFWQDIVFPLAFIGAPATFPPLGGDELEAAKQGVPAFLLFLDVVPYQYRAPEEQGMLGAFPAESLSLPNPAFAKTPNLRLIKVGTASIKEPIEKFDAAKTRDAMKRFEAELTKQIGAPVRSEGVAEAARMVDAAEVVLKDLKNMIGSGKDVCLRRLTEAEAAAEGMFQEVRNALQGSRIILLS